MISKELLSEVIGFECIPYLDEKYTNTIWVLTQHGWSKGEPKYSNAKEYPKGINIYELAHKCKEWALGQGIDLRTSARGTIDIYRFSGYEMDYQFLFYEYDIIHEAEAIFKACQWILENKL